MDYSIILLWLLSLTLAFSFSMFLSKQTVGHFSNSLSRSEDGIDKGEQPSIEQINDIFNRPVNLTNNDGDNVLLLFLSNTCSMCEGIFNILPEIQHKYQNTKIILFIQEGSNHPSKSPEELLSRFPAFPFNNNTHAILLTQELKESFKLIGFPFSYHLSKKGIVVNKGIVNTMQDINILMKGH